MVLQLLASPLTEKPVSEDQADALHLVDMDDDHDTSYQNVFAKLAVIDENKNHVVKMAKTILDAKVEVLKKISNKNQATGGKVSNLISQTFKLKYVNQFMKLTMNLPISS